MSLGAVSDRVLYCFRLRNVLLLSLSVDAMVLWFKWFLLDGLLLIVMLALGGYLYELLMRVYITWKYPPPGSSVDIGGYKLHLHSTGEGDPTVILEDGLTFAGSLAWSQVQMEVAKFTQVCSYDRAGILWSEPSPHPRQAKQIAVELHTALKNAQITPPYILVGLSGGGIYSRLFADLYPDKVVGMVLVDASHPEQEERFPPYPVKAFPAGRLGARLINLLANTGMLRLLQFWFDPMPKTVPSQVKQISTGFVPQSAATLLQEMQSLAVNLHQAKQTQPLGDKPLVVLTSSRETDVDDLPPGWTVEYMRQRDTVWQALQAELAELSTNSVQLTSEQSGPLMYYDQPALVVNAIRQVVDAVRIAKPISTFAQP